MDNVTVGKFLSYTLRHHPEKLGLIPDKNGYVSIDELIEKVNATEKYKNQLSRERLDEIVKNDSKQRYAYNSDRTKIRAVQGHSFHVDVAKIAVPPTKLYHGTSLKAYNTIIKQGIKKMSRDYVHLSKDIETAEMVGLRHAKHKSDLVILNIDTKAISEEEFQKIKKYRSYNI